MPDVRTGYAPFVLFSYTSHTVCMLFSYCADTVFMLNFFPHRLLPQPCVQAGTPLFHLSPRACSSRQRRNPGFQSVERKLLRSTVMPDLLRHLISCHPSCPDECRGSLPKGVTLPPQSLQMGSSGTGRWLQSTISPGALPLVVFITFSGKVVFCFFTIQW